VYSCPLVVSLCCRASALLPFRRCGGRRDGLAEQFSRAIISRVTDLMLGGVVAKNNLADHALIFGEVSFFDEMIGSVIFILSDETKLFLRTQDFGAGEAAVFIEIVANFFA